MSTFIEIYFTLTKGSSSCQKTNPTISTYLHLVPPSLQCTGNCLIDIFLCEHRQSSYQNICLFSKKLLPIFVDILI